MKPALYSIWHLNLMYSSIEIDRRIDVINKCFWPLIDLAKKGFKPAIEIPGLSLEIAQEIDPTWVDALRECCDLDLVELIGSGYSQLIAPLVPASVNKSNIREGFVVYKKLLGREPKIWMANEQTYSRGTAECLLDENISKLVIDWSNAFSSHPEWDENLVFGPQKTQDTLGRSIDLLWSDSLAFQKFQRYVHEENISDEYKEFLNSLYRKMAKNRNSSFCIYGNDAEIFDFRPGRFATEPTLNQTSEWNRIELLLGDLSEMGFEFIHPSKAFERENTKSTVEICTLSEPNSVKKQPKYNVTRWSLTGRGSSKLNQHCYNEIGTASPKQTCEIWSSDYRTHITEKRWEGIKSELTNFRPGLSISDETKSLEEVRFLAEDKKIHFESGELRVVLNPLRGLSIESVGLGANEPVLGRLEHGHFSRIDLSADWYSGNVVLQIPGRPQVTDLKKISTLSADNGNFRYFQSKIPFCKGEITKTFKFEITENYWTEEFKFDVPELPIGSLRFGFITFKKPVLEVRSHLGGKTIESFLVPNKDFDHGSEANSFVTANQAIGMTEGVLQVLTADELLTVELEESTSRPVAMVESKQTREGQFFRLYFSLSECDDTRRGPFNFANEFVRFKYRLEKR